MLNVEMRQWLDGWLCHMGLLCYVIVDDVVAAVEAIFTEELFDLKTMASTLVSRSYSFLGLFVRFSHE